MKWVLSWSGFALFRCHSIVYLREREGERGKKKKKKTTTTHAKNRNEKGEHMHEKCMNM